MAHLCIMCKSFADSREMLKYPENIVNKTDKWERKVPYYRWLISQFLKIIMSFMTDNAHIAPYAKDLTGLFLYLLMFPLSSSPTHNKHVNISWLAVPFTHLYRNIWRLSDHSTWDSRICVSMVTIHLNLPLRYLILSIFFSQILIMLPFSFKCLLV